MFVLLSPAKKLHTQSSYQGPCTEPMLTQHMAPLVTMLKQKTATDLGVLMGISESLAQINTNRFKAMDINRFDHKNSLPALFAFAGDVYRSLNAPTLSPQALSFAQDHLLILSGLYGLIRPMDWLQPYRLEMKTALLAEQSLAQYWSGPIAEYLNQHSGPIINLASQEYSEALKGPIQSQIIRIDFKERRDGRVKTIGILAKRARGLMARFIFEQQIDDPTALKRFDAQGYRYQSDASSDTVWTFINEQKER